jgi:hypothetical protein
MTAVSTENPVTELSYAEAVEELDESLTEADQQANVDPDEEGYPSADELTNEQLVAEWTCRFDETLVLTDPEANPNR